MLQRIQTVYLFIAFVLVILPLFGLDLYHVQLNSTGSISMQIGSFSIMNEGVFFANSLLWVYSLIPALGILLTIFLFKDRKKQLTMARLSVVLVVFATGWIAYTGMQFLSNTDQNHGVSLQPAFYLLASSIVFIFLAIRGIRKDQKLVDSLNRLR